MIFEILLLSIFFLSNIDASVKEELENFYMVSIRQLRMRHRQFPIGKVTLCGRKPTKASGFLLV